RERWIDLRIPCAAGARRSSTLRRCRASDNEQTTSEVRELYAIEYAIFFTDLPHVIVDIAARHVQLLRDCAIAEAARREVQNAPLQIRERRRLRHRSHLLGQERMHTEAEGIDLTDDAV